MKILVLDQYPLVSEMMAMLIRRVQPRAEIISVSSFNKLYKLIDDSSQFNAIFIDPKAQGCFGFSSVMHLVERLPSTKIIVLSDLETEQANNDYVKNAFLHSINKNDNVREISLILQELFEEKSDVKSDLLEKANPIKISKRHRQLINFLDKGYSNSRIALELGVSEQTVKVHFYRLYKILGVNSRYQALHFAKNHGWVF